MKRFESQKAYLVCMVIMGVFISILAGCGGGGGGVWKEPGAAGTPGTPGTTNPIVSSTVPGTDATNVFLNAVITATFSKAMNPATIVSPATSFSLKEFVSGTPVVGVVTYVGNTATFNPNIDLSTNTKYTATITTAAKDLAGNALASDYVWSFTTGTGLVPSTVPLGLIETYGMFGGTAGMTNKGILTVVNGDIGTTSTNTVDITGFRDATDNYTVVPGVDEGLVTGTINTCAPSTASPVNAAKCAAATQARLIAVDVFNSLAAKPSTGVLAGNLAGTTIFPGVYTNSSSVLIQGGDLTLDALGDPNAVFVFQIGSTLTIGGPGAAFPQSIILQGSAKAKNVFWQVGTSATINAGGGGTIEGSIFANSGVTFSTAGNVTVTTLNGRAVSLISSVTLVNTVINMPTP